MLRVDIYPRTKFHGLFITILLFTTIPVTFSNQIFSYVKYTQEIKKLKPFLFFAVAIKDRKNINSWLLAITKWQIGYNKVKICTK